MAYYDDMCEDWELVRESFHDKLSSETINLWFGTLRIVSFKGRELTMSIKSPFKYDIIKEKYLGEIKARLQPAFHLRSVRTRQNSPALRHHERGEKEKTGRRDHIHKGRGFHKSAH